MIIQLKGIMDPLSKKKPYCILSLENKYYINFYTSIRVIHAYPRFFVALLRVQLVRHIDLPVGQGPKGLEFLLSRYSG